MRDFTSTTAFPRGSLDLLGVDFLSVVAMIGVASHVALSVTDKRDASEIHL